MPNFDNPADHPGRIDINWLQLNNVQFNSGQTFHMNSVSYNAEEDVILLFAAIWGEFSSGFALKRTGWKPVVIIH